MTLTSPYTSFWIALATSGMLAYPILLLLRAMKSRQTVSQYAPEGHAKKQGTPTMGGLIIVAGFLVAMLYQAIQGDAFPGRYHYYYYRSDLPGGVTQAGSSASVPWSGALVVVFLLFALIGFVDDYVVPRVFTGKRGLGWKQKIVLEFFASLSFALPVYGSDPAAAALAVFLLLFFSNAFNFADGLDGLSGSLLLTMAFGLAGIAPSLMQLEALGPLAALAGATIPFLFLNAPPAKLFMGDVGSLGIGAVFGAIVMTFALPPGGWRVAPPGVHIWCWIGLAIWSIVMIVELVPVPLQIASVKLRKKKIFLYTPIHHAFEKAGWPESRVVWSYALAQLVLSIGAMQIVSWGISNLDREMAFSRGSRTSSPERRASLPSSSERFDATYTPSPDRAHFRVERSPA